MAVIGKIRDRFGVVISIVIGLSLLGFLLMSALDSQTSLFRKQNTTIAKVDGSSIDYNEFASLENYNLEEHELFQNNGAPLNEQTRQSIREQTWNDILQQTIMQKKYDQLGIQVTNEEMQQQLAGNNPHAVVRQQFTNPKTQQYSPANVTNFLNSDEFKNNKDNWQKRWAHIEKYVQKDRITNKYNKLIAKGIYVPKWMAEMDYKDKNSKFDIAFAYVPFTKIADAEVKVTDDEVKAYAEKHIRRFQKSEDERKIDFVQFELKPSGADSASYYNNMAALIDSFHHTKNDSAMVLTNSEMEIDGKYYSKTKLMSIKRDSFFTKPVSAVVGPYFENDMIKISKIVSRKTMPDSVRASHILITVAQGADSAAANKRIDSIWNAIKKGAKFADMAARLSQDPGSKTKGGDLGFFTQGMMVPEFNDACFKGKKGDIVKVLTQYGVHLLQITDQKNMNPAVQVFTIAKAVSPSRTTTQTVTNIANEFAGKNNTATAFDNAAKSMKRTAGQIKQNDNNVNGIPGNCRDLIKNFIYNSDSKVGSVSQPYLVDNKVYVIAKLTNIVEKGQPDIETYRQFIETEIKKEKRTEIILKDINSKIAGKVDIAAVASAIGDTVHHAKNVSLVQPFIAVGYEPKVVGVVTAGKANTISKPISGNNGVYIVVKENEMPAPAQTDFTMSRAQLEGQFGSGIEYSLFNSIKKNLDLKDNRVNFF